MLDRSTDSREKLLVLDDERLARELVGSELGWTFDRIATCATIDEALEVVRRQHFDVVLIDLAPRNGISGLAALELLRAEGCTAAAILTTDAPCGVDAERADRLGVRALLEKPFELGALARALRAAGPSDPRAVG